MKKYLSPFIILANGTINMTVSQLGQLGITIDVGQWAAFWEASGDLVQGIFPTFDIQNPDTWPEGFDSADPNTWHILIDGLFED